MPGLDPGIHRPSVDFLFKMDGRVKPGNDEGSDRIALFATAIPILKS
jgi:hypothetical protein